MESNSNNSVGDTSHRTSVDEKLLWKIREVCSRGGDGVKKTAVRMEIAELIGWFLLLNRIHSSF
ncbi:unnamed protein product [Anisakis simplex]|uniref:Uncharacterized protein n=1 Tax=Anisakis simplex TaxID=6269 RepID=A0A0M3JPE6_ANISI|nr:unnamed protein product [Anisakis simplex]